jgi:hypothetical protein
MIVYDREALCERLVQYFEQNPRITKHAAHELTMATHTVDDQKFVVSLTWGEVVDAIIPMLSSQPEVSAEQILGSQPARKRWRDLMADTESAVEGLPEDRARAFKALVREAAALEIALSRLLKEVAGQQRERGWTIDDELAVVHKSLITVKTPE